MIVTLSYKESSIEVQVEESRCAGVLYPNEVICHDETALIRQGLNQYFGALSWNEFISGSDEILIIVNDATRPTPTARILESLGNRFPLNRCRFLIATGSHKAPDQKELEWIFGALFHRIDISRIHSHDAKNESELITFGVNSRGKPLKFNYLLKKIDKILIITTVEPHYFAGFTGGRKSLLPGVAGYQTITNNHKLALLPESSVLKLEGNPIHEEMNQCLADFSDKKIFTIQAVMNRYRELVSVSAGNIETAFADAVDSAKKVFCVKLDEKVDIVVSVAPYPMDIDLYQSQKALENAKPAVKQGGIIILVSSCRKGIGPETFYKLMSSCSTSDQVMAKLQSEYRLGYHKAAKMVETGLMAKVIAVTDLTPEKLKKVFIEPATDIQSAVDNALKEMGPDSRICFLPEGSITVPVIR